MHVPHIFGIILYAGGIIFIWQKYFTQINQPTNGGLVTQCVGICLTHIKWRGFLPRGSALLLGTVNCREAAGALRLAGSVHYRKSFLGAVPSLQADSTWVGDQGVNIARTALHGTCFSYTTFQVRKS